MKHFVVALLLVIPGQIVFAQQADTTLGWKKDVVANLNLTQASFSNWQQGGENTLAWQVGLKTDFTLEAEKWRWSNPFKFALGFTKIQGISSRKSADDIVIESTLIRKFDSPFNAFLSLTARTQFAKGFEYDADGNGTVVSKFLDPGYFTQSLGVGYTPGPVFETRLGGTIKTTVTQAFPRYSNDPDTEEIEKTRVELGVSSVSKLVAKFHENIRLKSDLGIFSNLKGFDRIDVLLQNELLMKVTKIITVTVEVDLYYDKDISDELQVRQVLAIGFTFDIL